MRNYEGNRFDPLGHFPEAGITASIAERASHIHRHLHMRTDPGDAYHRAMAIQSVAEHSFQIAQSAMDLAYGDQRDAPETMHRFLQIHPHHTAAEDTSDNSTAKMRSIYHTEREAAIKRFATHMLEEAISTQARANMVFSAWIEAATKVTPESARLEQVNRWAAAQARQRATAAGQEDELAAHDVLHAAKLQHAMSRLISARMGATAPEDAVLAE